MGVICILLGIITFFCFTGVGAILGNAVVEYKTTLTMAVTSLSTVSNASLLVAVVGFFAFIGLLIGMNLIMHGLTYNMICKMNCIMKRR